MFDSCICVEPDNLVVILSHMVIVACERHVCGECGQLIEIGQKYERDTVTDGKVFTHKTCIPCRNVRDSMMKCGWYYGGVWEEIHQEYCGFLDDDDEECCICPD